MLHRRILPVTNNYLALFAHAGTDKSEFPVTMCGLIQIHKIHINRIPGDVAIELGMQMDKWFL